MTRDEVLSTTFPILMGMVVVGFILYKLLTRRLEARHPRAYRQTGAPSLYARNNWVGNAAISRFMFRREHLRLNDTYLSVLSDCLLGLTVVFGLLFLIPFLSIFLGLRY